MILILTMMMMMIIIGIIMIVILILRFDPSFFSVRERVRAGDLGHVHMIKVVITIECYSMLELTISSLYFCHSTCAADPYPTPMSLDDFSRLATTFPGLPEDKRGDLPRLRRPRHRPHHLDPRRVPHRGQPKLHKLDHNR